jgi:hypothetical protein
MLRTIDRVFGLMILGCVGHTLGTMKFYPAMSDVWVWSLGTSLAGFLLGATNLLRASRLNDKPLAAITLTGTAAFAFVAIGFGRSIHNMADPRVVGNLIIATALVALSARSLTERVTR